MVISYHIYDCYFNFIGEFMRVLLVEDDASTAKAIELSLASEGIICDTTELGEEGLEIGRIYDYDIIILDLMLPDIYGGELLQRLKKIKKIKNIPIIIQTGIADPEELENVIKLGACAYINKPFSEEILQFNIKKCLQIID